MAEAGQSWIVGFHAVLGAVEGGQPVEIVWLLDGRSDSRARRVHRAAKQRGLQIRRVARAKLDQVAGGVPHNGCAARCAPIPCVPLDAVVASAGEPGRLLLLDDVTDPHNVGAVIRTAAAFGVDGVILGGRSTPPLGGAVAKAAAGQLARIRLVRAQVAGDAVARLRDAGYWAVGADASGQRVSDVSPSGRWVLCVGSEERGLRAKTRSQIDEWVAVPISPDVESLNLSVATGILLYEMAFRWAAEAG